VTVIEVWRELQNSQKKRPENRQAYKPVSGGNPASDASPNPAGTRYAANVTPAAMSLRKVGTVTERSQEAAGIHPMGRVRFNGNGRSWIYRERVLRSNPLRHNLRAQRQLP